MKVGILLAAIVAVVIASDVLELNGGNFDEAITTHPLILVEFYAPWCGHCKKLAPEYEIAATELKGENLPLAKVDATAEDSTALGQRFGVRGYPTIKLFRNGGAVSDYQGERTAPEIVSFMRRQARPAVVEIKTAQDLTAFTEKEKVAVAGFFTDKESTDYKNFAQIADKLRESFIFGVVFDPKVAAGVEVTTFPTVVLFKKFDDKKNVLTGSDNLATLESFILTNSIPWLDEIGPANYASYSNSGKPVAFFFVEMANAEAKEKYTPFLHEIAKNTLGKMFWVLIDSGKYARYGERIGLTGTVSPALAIEDFRTGFHYAFDESKEITKEAVIAFKDDFLAGKIEPTIKSEPIPEPNDDPVKVIVAKNFAQAVIDNDKDVLLEFYAPWCGHCKHLAPIYEEVATELAGVETLVIAKMDATANDVDPKYNIQGFPTIKFFKAGSKQTPIDYSGGRTKEDFINFLEENVTHKFVAVDKDEL